MRFALVVESKATGELAYRQLARALKCLKRSFALRCVHAAEVPEEAPPGIPEAP